MKVTEIAACDIRDPEQFRLEIVQACRPVVLRGLVSDWPVVRAGLRSPRAVKDYIARFAAGGPVDVFFGAPEIAGKYYYKDDLQGFNFERRPMRIEEALELIVASIDETGAPSAYVGSVSADDSLPGFSQENPMPLVEQSRPRIWLGHRSNVSLHYDGFENIACCIAGRRRFTLYAPELIDRLYVGPIDNTMAGQPVSLAASAEPGDPRYPLFHAIADQALITELEPGDALFLPKLWWHKVEGLAPFNGLVNYWWDQFSAGPDIPYVAMLFAMITIAERPLEERKAWRAYFDNYVFRLNGHPLAHLPSDKHGFLGPLKPDNYGKIRAFIMQRLRGG